MKLWRLHSKKCLAIFSVLAIIMTLASVMSVTMVSATSTNLLTTEGLTSGNQSIKAYKFAFVGSDLWDLQYPYTYGAASLANNGVIVSGHTVSNLVDGVLTQKVQFAYGDANNPNNIVARRLALLIDLGAASNLTSITLDTPCPPAVSTYYELYDYTVYAGNVNDAATLASTDNCVGHYQTMQSNTATASIELTGATNVQYVLVIFNKMATDPGKNGTGTAGQYGDAGLNYPKSAYQDGALILSEIAINGTRYEAPTISNLLTNDGLTSGAQSIAGYELTGVDFSWDKTFGANTYNGITTATTALYAGVNEMTSTAIAPRLVDGNKAAYQAATTVQVSADTKAAAAAGRRVAMLVDLGSASNLASMRIDMAQQYASSAMQLHAVYDCSVYAGNTDNVALLASSPYFVTNYTNATKTTVVEIPLTDVTNVRYVLIVFNKVTTDPGSTDSNTSGQYGEAHKPATYSGLATYGSVRLSELAINGWASAEQAVQLATPTTDGAYINAGLDNAIQFESSLPATAAPEGYSIVKYGTLVTPNQYLPGGKNVKAGAALEYGNRYVAAAEIEVAEGGAAVPADKFAVELIGSAQGVYPGVKFAARSYVIYQKNGTQQMEIKYGDTVVLSVYGTARLIAKAMIEAKDSLEIEYTDSITAETTVADIEAAKTSGTVPSLVDVFEFVTKPENLAAVDAAWRNQ